MTVGATARPRPWVPCRPTAAAFARPRPPTAPTPPTERTPFHEMLQSHDEQQRSRKAGRMSFISSQTPAADLPAEGDEQP